MQQHTGIVPTDAARLEAALRTAGFNPDEPETYDVWDAWSRSGLAAALKLLEVGAPPPGGPADIDPNPARRAAAYRPDTAQV